MKDILINLKSSDLQKLRGLSREFDFLLNDMAIVQDKEIGSVVAFEKDGKVCVSLVASLAISTPELLKEDTE